MDLARRFGWSSEKATSHGGLTLICPSADPNHKIRVFSTGKGSEGVARTSRKRVGRCEHRDFRDPLGRVETALEEAAKLLRAAKALLERNDAQQSMLEILELASEQLADAEAAFDEANQDLDNAQDLVGELLGAEGADAIPSDLLGVAGSQLRTAELTLRELPSKDATVERLGIWLDELKSQRVALRVWANRYGSVPKDGP
ncbi:hypothetical protein [Pseudarthrobacter sulfonivorans]|uniref:hypothetical protein n=1 Tax=Pseudarthrobacter sulfonivorans TaxID=121292 RepID=UPI00168A8003|nr:hypothetical protein [Pseudarthrobacter sulfonivorans]